MHDRELIHVQTALMIDRKQLRCSSRSYDFITDDTTRNIKRLAIEENSEPSSLRVTIKRENEESRRQVSFQFL